MGERERGGGGGGALVDRDLVKLFLFRARKSAAIRPLRLKHPVWRVKKSF